MAEKIRILGTITWTCHICKQERPNDRISVISLPLIIQGRVCGEQNIRYCNDKQERTEKAQNFRGWIKDEQMRQMRKGI